MSGADWATLAVKSYLKLNPIHDLRTPAQSATQLNSAIARSRHVFRLGLDIDLNFVVTAVQCDHGAIKPAHKWTRAQLIAWVRQQVEAGHTVHTVYEACGFGYTLHEQLTAAGAHSLVTTPMRLSPERRRKNDRLVAHLQAEEIRRARTGRRRKGAEVARGENPA